MKRRDFLRLTVLAAAAVELPQLVGCASSEEQSLRVFPQGVASGDPRSDRVVLWTRVEPHGAGSETARFELATDEAFAQLIVSGDAPASAEADHTVRVLATGLAPATTYFYRFVARGVTSTVGRTRTAPDAGADVRVRFALASCQDLVGRWFHAWDALADEPALDLVVFLGDYIYETDQTLPVRVPTHERAVTLPDGLTLATPDEGRAALTLADYRALYRRYKQDPDLRRIHATAPFALIWDDHEFSNDCWQDRTYYFDGAQGDEQRTPSRQAATRAWFEYLPVDVEWRSGASFPDDIVTYRALRFGRHVELFLGDSRYYRDAHLIQPGPADAELGKAANSMLGARTFVKKAPFDTREAAAAPSMLGATQRTWLLDGIRASSASWKLWCNQTMLAQLLVDLRPYPEVAAIARNVFYFKLDQWDGYRTERRMLLEALADVPGFAVLSGDLHGFYASELKADFDAPSVTTTVEYVVSSISAPTLQEQLQGALQVSLLLQAAGLGALIPRSDELITSSNPHIRYSNSARYGYAIVEVSAAELGVEFVTLADVKSPERPPVERVRFRTLAGEKTIERL